MGMVEHPGPLLMRFKPYIALFVFQCLRKAAIYAIYNCSLMVHEILEEPCPSNTTVWSRNLTKQSATAAFYFESSPSPLSLS